MDYPLNHPEGKVSVVMRDKWFEQQPWENKTNKKTKKKKSKIRPDLVLELFT